MKISHYHASYAFLYLFWFFTLLSQNIFFSHFLIFLKKLTNRLSHSVKLIDNQSPYMINYLRSHDNYSFSFSRWRWIYVFLFFIYVTLTLAFDLVIRWCSYQRVHTWISPLPKAICGEHSPTLMPCIWDFTLKMLPIMLEPNNEKKSKLS